MLGFLLGTSIPIVPFPGIGAIILIPKADNERAISSSKFLILEIRIPASGTISYSVTVCPIVALLVDANGCSRTQRASAKCYDPWPCEDITDG